MFGIFMIDVSQESTVHVGKYTTVTWILWEMLHQYMELIIRSIFIYLLCIFIRYYDINDPQQPYLELWPVRSCFNKQDLCDVVVPLEAAIHRALARR